MSIRKASVSIAVVLVAIVGVSVPVYAQSDHAVPRERDRAAKSSGDRRAQKAPDHESRWAPSRRPQPDISTKRLFEYRDYSMYDWTRYDRRPQWSRDRFPRFFNDVRFFNRRRYHGETFGPHYRLWYRYAGAWMLFYWPYANEPSRGCTTYFVPTNRRLSVDLRSRFEYWEYTDYRRLYICFD